MMVTRYCASVVAFGVEDGAPVGHRQGTRARRKNVCPPSFHRRRDKGGASRQRTHPDRAIGAVRHSFWHTTRKIG